MIFADLPDTYTIFIIENDILKKRLPVYTIKRMNFATGEQLGDPERC